MEALRKLAIPMLACALAACGGDASNTQGELQDSAAVARTLSSSERETICKAAIGDINGQDPGGVTVASVAAAVIRINHAPSETNKVSASDCRVEDNRILWRPIDIDGPGTGPGRWRDGPGDAKISFTLNGAQATITTAAPGESPTSNTYTVN